MTAYIRSGNQSRKSATRFDKNRRDRFLTYLSETANVTASAKHAGISTSLVYAQRKKSPEFRDAWADALAEGYALLEADLLREALQEATGSIKDSTLKARAQKHRLALALLSAHRSTVKEKEPKGKVNENAVSLDHKKQELLAKLQLMQKRMAQKNAK